MTNERYSLVIMILGWNLAQTMENEQTNQQRSHNLAVVTFFNESVD